MSSSPFSPTTMPNASGEANYTQRRLLAERTRLSRLKTHHPCSSALAHPFPYFPRLPFIHPSFPVQVAYQNMTAESSRMAYKLAGRCPLVINYGHMSNLSLADAPSSTRPSPSGPGSYGKSPYPGAVLDDPSAGMGPYGPLMGPGGGGMPAWMGGAPGGAPGMGPGKKAAAGEGAGGAGKEKVKEGRRRKVSDFDRVLATHASRCKQGATAGQGLVKAIRSAQDKAGELQTGRLAMWVYVGDALVLRLGGRRGEEREGQGSEG